MDEAKNRVFEEKKELEGRLFKLTTFICLSEKYKILSKLSRKLLKKQEWYMQKYLNVLKARLRAWEE